MRSGVCKLCGEEKQLINRSHIIPNFMYKEIFDNQTTREIYEISITNNRVHKKKQMTGSYDKHILCQYCDNNVIGKYEAYAAKVLYNAIQTNLEFEVAEDFSNNLKYYKINNLNYRDFKLFLLCIFWKSSISQHNTFNNVVLGSYYENILKQMIQTEIQVKNMISLVLYLQSNIHQNAVNY